MSRFSRLEFEGPDPAKPTVRPSSTSPSPPTPDTSDYAARADDERREGHHENALRYYSRALESDRSQVACWTGQAQMLVFLGEYPEAELWARKASEMFRQCAPLLATRAHALCRKGDTASAQPLADEALRCALGTPSASPPRPIPASPAYPWIVRGEILLARRDAMATHCFDRAVALDGDWIIRVEASQSLQFHGHSARAVDLARTATDLAPTSCYCWYQRATCERSAGLERAALASFHRCLELKPAHTDAQRQLAGLAPLTPITPRPTTHRSLLRRLFSRR